MKLRAALPLAILALPVIFMAASARAATPTPTGTSTPAPTASTPIVPAPALFGGQAWVDARVAGDRAVTAKIGDTVCATDAPPFIVPTDGGVPTFGLAVPSAEALPGCGREGAVITFFVGDQQVPQTAIWHAGESHGVGLIVGPPFARFNGGISVNHDRLPGGDTIVPYVGDAACGYTLVAPTGDGYLGIVFSVPQQRGCGAEGSTVTFKLLDTKGNVISVARETGIWHAWDGTSPQQLNLIFGSAGGIRVGNVGGGPDSAASPWLGLSLGLALVGLASGIGGFVLRRRLRPPPIDPV